MDASGIGIMLANEPECQSPMSITGVPNSAEMFVEIAKLLKICDLLDGTL
jgi:hypothetical protein